MNEPCFLFNFKADYKEWNVQPHRNFGPQNEHHQLMDKFSGESIYTTDYIDHGFAKPPNAIRPAAQLIQSGPFDAISTFTADYVPRNVGKLKMPTENYLSKCKGCILFY